MSWKLPAVQFAHDDWPRCGCAVRAGQRSQDSDPFTAANLPASQSAHADTPLPPLNVPGPQSTQPGWPGCDWKVREGQARQGSELPLSLAKRPAAHAVHADALNPLL